jgi:hypothetical protein
VSGPSLQMALVVGHVYVGIGYLLSPRLSSEGSYAVALALAPANVWGWAIVAGAPIALLAPLVPFPAAAALRVLAAAPPALFALALLAAQVTGTAEGWGRPLAYVVPAILHGLLLRARHRWEHAHA